MADAPAEPKSGKMKMIILVVVALLGIAGAGAGGYFVGNHGAPKEAEAKTEKAAAKPADPGLGPTVALDNFIVNLLDDQDTRYLKAAITLETDSQTAADEVTERKPQIRDAILLLLSSKTYNELRDLQGKLQLQAELTTRINGFLKNGKVTNIFFTDFVVQ